MGAALDLLAGLAGSDRPWGLPWPCAYEYLRVVTHPRVFDPPMRLEDALDNLASLLESPSVVHRRRKLDSWPSRLPPLA